MTWRLKIILATILLAGCTHTNSNCDFCKAELVEVYDGDTIFVHLSHLHPIFGHRLPIRIQGIDTPEIRSKNLCEKSAGKSAASFLDELLKDQNLDLKNCERGKYFRLVCQVKANGRVVAEEMIKRGHAVPYDGKASRATWSGCETP